jgi:hypothetical protein
MLIASGLNVVTAVRLNAWLKSQLPQWRNGSLALWTVSCSCWQLRLSFLIDRSSLSCRQPLAVMQLKGEGSKEWEQRCAWLISGFLHCIALCELSWHILCGGV